GDGDHGRVTFQAPYLTGRVPGGVGEVGGAAGDLEDGVEVDVAGDLLAEACDHVGGLAPLPRRNQPEVTRRRGDRVVAGDDAEHGQAQAAFDLCHVAGGSCAVEHHADDVDVRVVGGHAGDDRADGTGHAGDVDDQH